MTAPSARSTRIPSLDGLRALSITAVLIGHLRGTAGFPHWIGTMVQNRYVDLATWGVRVFFVISGYLITGLLMREAERTGTISLSRFYVRRALRIFPAYFALLGVLGALDAAGVIHVPTSDFLHALTYTSNYAAHRVWQVIHLWSLAVEEQFYLLWPAAVVLVGVRRSSRIAIAVICIVPVIKVAESMLFPEWRTLLIGTSFETTADALALGCLLALSHDSLDSHAWYRRAVSSRWVAPALLLLGVLISIRYRPALLLGETCINVAIALGVIRSVRRPDGRFGRLLNSRPLVYVGGLSYSLYLWQQLFLNRYSSATVNSFPLNVLLVVPCALASYYLVEQPFLRLRPRVEAWMDRRSSRRRLASAVLPYDRRSTPAEKVPLPSALTPAESVEEAR